MMWTRRILMATVVTLGLVAPVAAQEPPKQPPEGKISGRVVDAASGRPIRAAVVRVVTAQGRQLSAGTDVEGRFEFTALAAGQYRLEARADRYLAMHFGGTPALGLAGVPQRPIVLREGEHFDRADVALPRAGAVEGRVLDEFGDPAPNVTVRLSQLTYAAGRRRLMPVGGPTQSPTTDDKGQFRIAGLQPGTYFVSALSGVFTDQNGSGGFAPTYYPGTPAPADAGRVRVGYGTDVTGLVINLVPAKSARMSGRVVDAGGAPVAGANLVLAYSDRLGISDFVFARAAAGPDGAFTLRNVPPGQYTLQGYGRPPAGGPQNLNAGPFGWLMVAVDGEDQAGLVLRVSPGTSLRGRIVLAESSGPPLTPNDVMVATVPIEFDSAPVAGGPPPSVHRDDWTFEVSHQSGQRLIRVSTRSPAWMLDRVTLDGRDITDTPIDFRKADVNDVEVVLTSRVSAVEGHVSAPDGKPLAEYTVILFATDDRKWTDRSRFLLSARPAQDGRFRLQGVPPDDYLAVALPYVQGLEWTDPEFLAAVRDRATRVTVAEGETQTIALVLRDRP
jgi:5-hydroxyisourate hydrolase-like protein (transthyretin family)